MTYQGIDTAARISADAARKLKAEGVSFVGRYLVPERFSNAVTAEEIAGIRDAGLAILLCWELGAKAMAGGSARGARDGAQARQLAESFGVPSGTCVFFAADYNVPDDDLAYCLDYVRAAQAALGPYVAGAYGPERLVGYLASHGVKHLWQCVAWSNSYIAPLRQYQWQGSPDAQAMAAKVGFAVDLDSAESLDGLWLPDEAKPWYAEAMTWAENAGLIRDGRPNDYVTRAELATVLYRIYGPEDTKTDSGLLTN